VSSSLIVTSTYLSGPDSLRLSAQTIGLLDESADDLLGGCIDVLRVIRAWIDQLRQGRWKFWGSEREKIKKLEAKVANYEETRRILKDVLYRFRNEKRYDYQALRSKDAHPTTTIHVLQIQGYGALSNCL
jgi:hypothetical protein